MAYDPNKPMVFKIGTVRQQVYKKSDPDLQPILEKELGTTFIDNHTVFTKFKLYCKMPNWKHPRFTYKIQMANGSQNTSVFASMSPTELNDLIASMVKWLYDNQEQHNEAQELSTELLRRHSIAETQEELLSDLSIDPDNIEQEIAHNKSLIIEKKYQERNILTFLKHFELYIKSNNSKDQKVHLDTMTSLLPDYTNEIIDLISRYTSNPSIYEEDIDKLKEQLKEYFTGGTIVHAYNPLDK